MARKLVGAILLLTIIAAAIAAGILGYQRYVQETKNRQVEMSVEYAEVLQIAQQSGKSYEQVLENLKGAGVTGVFFKEQSADDLDPLVWIKGGGELQTDANFAKVKQQINPRYNYLLTMDEKLAQRLNYQLRIKLPTMKMVHSPEGPYLIGAPITKSSLRSIGLGFPEKEIALAEGLGLNIQVQIKSWSNTEDEDIAAVFASLQKIKRLDLVLFNDKTIPGFPGKYLLVANEIKKLGVPVGLIEFYPQEGFNQLANALEKNVVRLHSIAPAQMSKMTPNAARDRYTLAVTERNIRSILVRMFFNTKSTDWLGDNTLYLESLKDSITNQGYTLGSPQAIQGPLYHARLTILIGLGVIAGGIVLLKLLGFGKLSYLLGLLGLLGWLGLLFTGHGIMVRKLFALGSVIIFPSAAVLLNLRNEGVDLGKSILLLVRTSCISLIGALLMVGLLADSNFMLKLDQFSGVKIAHLIPIVLIIGALFWRLEKHNLWHKIREILNANLKVFMVLMAVFLTLALAIYIMRTGNDAAPVSGLELTFRSWLDKILLVRPRTKEFLIGHPLMLLSFYLGYKHRYLPLLVLGIIGQISMVNTFAHIHTPLVISLLRAFHGLWLGILIGVILILLYKVVASLGRRGGLHG
ncbi:DUF5693 family protein [Bacillota bacterium LX-D]|nr:DUF5693 family protein [Bacillota bacterium LX-D]